MILFSVLFLASFDVWAKDKSVVEREYQIKAAFLYNFIKFVDWPEEKLADSNEPVVIGIIGSKDFIKASKTVEGKKIEKRIVVIKYFEGFEESKKTKEENDSEWNQKLEALKICHVVMFCTCDSTEIKNTAEIIKLLKEASVLTVGETPEFLEAGGVINFVMEQKKVRLEEASKNLENSIKACKQCEAKAKTNLVALENLRKWSGMKL